MYSPKIKPDLIPALYHLAKRKKMPMTKLIDEIIQDYFRQIKDGLGEMRGKLGLMK